MIHIGPIYILTPYELRELEAKHVPIARENLRLQSEARQWRQIANNALAHVEQMTKERDIAQANASEVRGLLDQVSEKSDATEAWEQYRKEQG